MGLLPSTSSRHPTPPQHIRYRLPGNVVMPAIKPGRSARVFIEPGWTHSLMTSPDMLSGVSPPPCGEVARGSVGRGGRPFCWENARHGRQSPDHWRGRVSPGPSASFLRLVEIPIAAIPPCDGRRPAGGKEVGGVPRRVSVVAARRAWSDTSDRCPPGCILTWLYLFTKRA